MLRTSRQDVLGYPSGRSRWFSQGGRQNSYFLRITHTLLAPLHAGILMQGGRGGEHSTFRSEEVLSWRTHMVAK